MRFWVLDHVFRCLSRPIFHLLTLLSLITWNTPLVFVLKGYLFNFTKLCEFSLPLNSVLSNLHSPCLIKSRNEGESALSGEWWDQTAAVKVVMLEVNFVKWPKVFSFVVVVSLKWDFTMATFKDEQISEFFTQDWGYSFPQFESWETRWPNSYLLETRMRYSRWRILKLKHYQLHLPSSQLKQSSIVVALPWI